MFDYSDFFSSIKNTPLDAYADALKRALSARNNARAFGDLPEWEAVLANLPHLTVSEYDLNSDQVTLKTTPLLNAHEKQQLTDTLMGLRPWRKGPFSLFDVEIDTEWRSDWKWQRIAPHISDLTGKTVLDIGCGSGYHAWRMRGAGAKLVLGIEPMPKFIFQFQAIKKYLPHEPVFVLPLCCEDMPKKMASFDTVFSMGVLYHRKSPIDHLEELKNLLKPGGELVLETLVVEGDGKTLLVPEGRYAKMRNVWFIPSVDQLVIWLKKVGFTSVQCVDVNQTSLHEQRPTEWMAFESLQHFLDPTDSSKTIEGYPAPQRATLHCRL